MTVRSATPADIDAIRLRIAGRPAHPVALRRSLFAGVNALNFTTKTWVTILLVASYDLFFIIRPSCRSRM